MIVRYCTAEWLEENAKGYRATSHFEEAMKRVTTKIFFRITAEPAWGIEEDMIFGATVEEGKLLDLGFYNERKAGELADFILAATPQQWKLLLRKEKKFITEFLLGKIKQESGSKAALLSITPYANHFVDSLTQYEMQFPDEMSAEELATFRSDLAELRASL